MVSKVDRIDHPPGGTVIETDRIIMVCFMPKDAQLKGDSNPIIVTIYSQDCLCQLQTTSTSSHRRFAKAVRIQFRALRVSFTFHKCYLVCPIATCEGKNYTLLIYIQINYHNCREMEPNTSYTLTPVNKTKIECPQGIEAVYICVCVSV